MQNDAMGRFLRNLLRNATDALGDSLSSRTYEINHRGFATDAEKIRGDFSAVGRDMRKTLKREQQANNRAR